MDTTRVGETLRDARVNAALAWTLVALVGLAAVASVLEDPVWAGFAAALAVLGALPAVISRSLRSMLPFEVLGLAALPVLGRAFGNPGAGGVATYLGVAAVALVVAVELDAFTDVEMNVPFALLFVVVSTLAAAGAWAVARYAVDSLLGTSFLLPPRPASEAAMEAVEEALMIEFLLSTVAGLAAGLVFELYFRRVARPRERLPEVGQA
jgi:hypothetical protein